VPLDTYDYQLEQYSTTNFFAELRAKVCIESNLEREV